MSKREKILVILSVVLLVIASLYMSWTFAAAPALEERERLSRMVEGEENRVDELEIALSEARQAYDEADTDTTLIQRKLPVPALTDQLILGLNQAQELSGVTIQDIFLDYNQPLDRILLSDPEVVTEIDDEEPVEVEIDEIEELDGVVKQTMTLDVRVNTYEDLAAFLWELDQLERIINVESVYFSGANTTQVFDGDDDIYFEVNAAAFYYPGLDTLLDEAPDAHYLDSPEREQPFSD